jgi:hypothetical protein
MTVVRRRWIGAGAKYFSRNFRLYIAFFIQLGFIATFWAADIAPFSLNRYFLKSSMLFTDKLIDRHHLLLDAKILLETSPINIFGQQRGLL